MKIGGGGIGGKVTRGVIAGTIGGIASNLIGGSFSMGARLGAMSRFFNDEHGFARVKDFGKQVWNGVKEWFANGPDAHINRNVNQSCPTTCDGINNGDYFEEGQAPLHGGDEGYFTYRGIGPENRGFQCTYQTQCSGNPAAPLIQDPAYAGNR